MENSFDLDKQRVKATEVLQIIKEHKDRSNKDLQIALEFINEDFKVTKESLIKLTHHLDATEKAYNKLLDEFQNRTKQ